MASSLSRALVDPGWPQVEYQEQFPVRSSEVPPDLSLARVSADLASFQADHREERFRVMSFGVHPGLSADHVSVDRGSSRVGFLAQLYVAHPV